MKIVHITSSHSGSQKCHISLNALKKLNCSLGSALQIRTNRGTYICRLFLNSDLSDSMAIVENTVQLFKERQNNILKHPIIWHEDPQVLQLDCCLASQVTVTVIVGSFQDAHLLKQVRLLPLITNLLSDKFVVQHSLLRLPKSTSEMGILSIFVLETIPYHSAIYVTGQTEVKIESIITQNWFEQQERISKALMSGVDEIYNKLKEVVIYPLKFPTTFSKLRCPKGILLHGPSGCGKSSIVHKLCNEFNLHLMVITSGDVTSPAPGESETKIKMLFEECIENCRANPTVLFFDDLNSFCPRRGGHSHTDRLTISVANLLDDLDNSLPIAVIAATNKLEEVDPALRRPGRLDREIYFGVPSIKQREEILESVCQNFHLKLNCKLEEVAEITPGYVGADLNLLCCEVLYATQDHGYITLADFKRATGRIRSALLRQGQRVVEFKKVNWDQIGGLEEAQLRIRRSIEWPLKNPESFARLGVPCPKGVLIYGPPGCGKSLLVRAAATSCAASFLSISAAELFSPFVGDSEKMVSSLFQRARLLSPCILFLDELDAMVGGRSMTSHGRTAQLGVIATLLQEMDGVSSSISAVNSLEANDKEKLEYLKNQIRQGGVLVVGATNRPDKIDPALLRPGRFDCLIYIRNPDEKSRLSILMALTRRMPLDNVNLEIIARKTIRFSGADLEVLCKEAGLSALEEDLTSKTVAHRHFEKALGRVPSSLDEQQIQWYEDYASGKQVKGRTVDS